MKCDRANHVLVSKSIKNQSASENKKDEQCLCDCQTVKRFSETDSDKRQEDEHLKKTPV